MSGTPTSASTTAPRASSHAPSWATRISVPARPSIATSSATVTTGAIGYASTATTAIHSAGATSGRARRFAGTLPASDARSKCHQEIGAVATVQATETAIGARRTAGHGRPSSHADSRGASA